MGIIRGKIESPREIVPRRITWGKLPDWTDDTIVEVKTFEQALNNEPGETMTYGEYKKRQDEE